MPKETFFNLPNEKQDKIIEEAIREFGEKGYDKGNIGEIAKASSVSKGSMYQYFEGKKELYFYCMKKGIEIVMSYMDIESVDYSRMNIFEYTYAANKNSWPLLKKNKTLFIFLQNLYFEKNSDIRQEIFEYALESSQDYARALIEKNKEQGFIRKDISTESIMLFVEGISMRFKEKMMKMIQSEGKQIYDAEFEEFEKIIKDMIILMREGIGI